jgi:hypothetical protein
MSGVHIPEGMTDPDEVDRWLNAREAYAEGDFDDAATALRRPRPDAVTDPDMVAAIRARIAYDRLPFWERWFTPRPPGMVDRYPTGAMH